MAEKIQLALQGGGAKVAALVAAMIAVQDLEQKQQIKVTRISGTSAGAIVATLFSAGVPMREVITYLKKTSYNSVFKEISLINMYYRILRGTPIYDVSDRFSSIFSELLNLGTMVRGIPSSPAPSTFSKLNIPTFVQVTDLQSRCQLTKKENDLIIPSVFDSCALPFGLKTHSSPNNAYLVDGGIVDNLPADLLSGSTNEYGPVIAFSFPRDASGVTKGLLGYGLSLMFAQIDSAVMQAKSRLGDEAVHEIATTLTTLSFPKIFGEKLSELSAELGAIEQSARDFILKWIETQTRKASQHIVPLNEDPWKAAESTDLHSAYVNQSLRNLYRTHQASCQLSKIAYLRTRMTVVAHSLAALDGTPPLSNTETISTTTEYQVTEGQLLSHAVAVAVEASNRLLRKPPSAAQS